MHPANFLGPLDTALLAAPFFAMLAAWMFGLDELLAAPRRKRRSRGFGLITREGRIVLTDPDGRPWSSAPPQPSVPVEKSNSGDQASSSSPGRPIL